MGRERISCSKAGRRVLAASVHARIDSPRNRVSAMDGYAVRQDDLIAGVTEYELVSHSFAGDPVAATLEPGKTFYVATGAHVPVSAASIIPFELVIADGPKIRISGELPIRRHIREQGSDFSIGDLVLLPGHVIDPRALVAIGAFDVPDVEVWRRPRLSVITTGDELVAPGAACDTSHCIPDSLGDAVLLLARQWGAKPIKMSRVPDEPTAIGHAAQEALAQADVVVFVGGASRGLRDFTKSALSALGLSLNVDTVAMKPGRPVWYGRIRDTHVFGLPGNPTAAMTVARLLVVPLLTAMGGRGISAGLRWQLTPAAAPIDPNGPREAFLCGALSTSGAAVIERQTASAQLLLAQADILIRRPQNAPGEASGALIQTLGF